MGSYMRTNLLKTYHFALYIIFGKGYSMRHPLTRGKIGIRNALTLKKEANSLTIDLKDKQNLFIFSERHH